MPFPTTSVLDDFTGAVNTVLPTHNANWQTVTNATDGKLNGSNQVIPTSISTTTANNWNIAYGPNSEIYIDVVTVPTSGGWCDIFARTQQGGNTTTRDGYVLDYNSGANSDISRVDNNAFTQLGSTFAMTLSNGDSIGLEVIGTTNNIKAYRKTGGTWSQVGATQSDATYTGTGTLELEIAQTATAGVFDNFGGGTVVVASSIKKMAIINQAPKRSAVI
jgi:hypothetical protein